MNVSKLKANKKKLIRIAVIIAAVAVVLIVAVLILRQKVTERYGTNSGDEILSASATVGSISTTVSGSGNLQDVDVEELELSSTVNVNEIYVSAGNKISDGDLLADVDMSSVVSAMKELQEQLDELDDNIASASSDTVSSYISASVAGRVKAVYVEAGSSIAQAMYEHGALFELSLDGYMAVDIEQSSLSSGERVTVKLSDDTSYDGTVDTCIGGTATILITDNGPKKDESVTVFSDEDKELGSGELYIHQSLSVTGYTGTVSSVGVSENSRVYSGSTLLYLSDTSYSGNYDALLKERSEIEEQLQQLIVIYKEGALYAHMSGSISSVTDLDSNDTTDADTQTLMSICPDKQMTVSVSVDEADILSLSLGQKAVVTVDSIGSDEFEGSVTEIETIGTSSSGVTYYTVTVTLDKASKMLSGMTASVVIRIEGVEGALIIPSDAITQTSSATYVYTTADETTGELGGMKEVTVGLNNGSYVEITGGLNENDTVYYIPSKEQSFSFSGFGGGMGGMSGDMSSMPDMSGSNMPSGGFSGGSMPDRSSMPSRGN